MDVLTLLQMEALALLSPTGWKPAREVRETLNAGRSWWFRAFENCGAAYYRRMFELQKAGLVIGRYESIQIGEFRSKQLCYQLTEAGELVRQGLTAARIIGR